MRTVALGIALAACGDNGGAGAADAVHADAFVPADASSCEPSARSVFRLDLFSPLLAVELDGAGTRCEQAIAALPQMAEQFPVVDRLLANPHTTMCDDFETEVMLSMGPPADLDGIPLVAPGWLVQVFVLVPSGDAFISGTMTDIPNLPVPGCLGELGLHHALAGRDLRYVELANGCFPSGIGEYTITVGDAFTVGREVLWVKPDAWTIHRAREVDIRLLPAHVTDPIRYSDLNCCPTLSLVDCVGTRAFVDGSTAEILDQFPRCDPSCPS